MIQSRSTSQELPYDFRSIMHFRHNAFSRVPCTSTLVPRSRRIPKTILGSWTTPTDLDFLHLNLLYCGGTDADLIYAVLPEILARILFSLNFEVGVGPRKLRARNFLPPRKFDHVEFVTTCTRLDFLHDMELLVSSSFSFLNELLMLSLLQYLQPASNKPPGSKCSCRTFCAHAESSHKYVTAKLALSNLPFVERSLCQTNSC